MENKLIGVAPVDREKYDLGIAALARLDALKEFTLKSEYSIDRKDIAAILGFELPEETPKGD